MILSEDKSLIIAIDGPAGAGKSTVAKILAKKLGYLHLNTGAMYRAITLKALQNNVDLEDENALVNLAKSSIIEFNHDGSRIFLDGVDVSKQIKTPEIDKNISTVVKHPCLRDIMVSQQRKIGEKGNIVSEGRDITTVVFPNAEVKIYLDASLEERAKRRMNELKRKGYDLDIEQVQRETARRDESDKTREYGALKVSEDAIILDTTNLTIDEVVQSILEIVEKRRL